MSTSCCLSANILIIILSVGDDAGNDSLVVYTYL